jgi:hypothetical protein
VGSELWRRLTARCRRTLTSLAALGRVPAAEREGRWTDRETIALDETNRVRDSFAASLREYLDDPSSRQSAGRMVCESLCRLLEQQLIKLEGWDRFLWLDGLVPREISVLHGELTIVGGVYVMNGQQTHGIWPLLAVVQAASGGTDGSIGRVLFGDRTPGPTPTNKEGRFDVHRLRVPSALEEWRFALQV